ncbi:hypothetical protein [Pelovirga terrestris]|uniref:Transposase DDE domain-containing protein n=1 Tax=Pelovirga terrestris TaxID=2771352 RepID=A0A8J6QNF5_9BACT|nr:hypothetical protein [Pelovirga terrestris]MBD1400073.1 hypothetical protein [Pelovirga terrestris]
MKTIAFQTELRPELPVVFGAKDYREFRETIEEVDHFLTATGIEHRLLVAHLTSAEDAYPEKQRRGSSEARISIFKNAYLGTPLRSKGFANRKTRIEWRILAHNLWKLAHIAVQNRQTATEHKEAA